MTEFPKELFKHWVHSYEEDSNDIKIYRPTDYNFPPSRGRDSFLIKENGEFIGYMGGPTDGSTKSIGYWLSQGPDKIKIYYNNRAQGTLNIILCENNILKIRFE